MKNLILVIFLTFTTIHGANAENEHQDIWQDIWVEQNYVDDFGEPINSKYITNFPFIKGTFSNTATENSSLGARFIVDQIPIIRLMLYPYSAENPLKVHTTTTYKVMLQDKDDVRETFIVYNNFDALVFQDEPYKILHNMLLKGGMVKFRITEEDRPSSRYSFDILSSDYAAAYEKLLKTNQASEN